MSDTVSYRGRLVRANNANIGSIVEDEEKYIVLKGVVYEVKSDQLEDGDDIFDMNENEDGSLGFLVRYYNGGCCFSEAIETAHESMERRKK